MSLDPRDDQVAEVVAEHGCSCQSVSAGGGDPAFAYSVGFPETLSAPEFIIFGLAPELMHKILWGVFRQVRIQSALLEAGKSGGLKITKRD